MANSLGIDFNPQPAYGSDPFTPIVEGVQMGLGLNRDIQNQKMQQQKFTQDQEQEVEKMKLLKFGQLVDIYDKTKSPKLKEIYYREAIKPAAKQILGADLPDDPGSFGDYFSAAAELSNQYSAGKMKFPDYKKRLGSIYFDALKAGDLEAASAIATGTRFGEEEASVDRQGRLDAGRLRVEFLNRPEVKEYVTINTQVKSMDSLLDKALAGDTKNKVALDQALISMFNKLTDPNSVVRESEFARTPENLPVVNRILGGIAKIQQGGAGLTNEDRKALVAGAKAIANERGAVLNDRRSEYESLAVDLGLDPSVVTRTIRPFVPYNVDGTRSSTVTFVDSDGIQHTIPKSNLDAARKRDPGLRLVK